MIALEALIVLVSVARPTRLRSIALSIAVSGPTVLIAAWAIPPVAAEVTCAALEVAASLALAFPTAVDAAPSFFI